MFFSCATPEVVWGRRGGSTQVDVYGTDLVTGYADRKCVQIAITEVGLVSATRCLQSALPFGVQAPNKPVTIVAQSCFNVLVTYTRNKPSSSSSSSSSHCLRSWIMIAICRETSARASNKVRKVGDPGYQTHTCRLLLSLANGLRAR